MSLSSSSSSPGHRTTAAKNAGQEQHSYDSHRPTPAPKESPCTSVGRPGAIQALNRIDDLPVVQEPRVVGNDRGEGSGSGNGNGKQQPPRRTAATATATAIEAWKRNGVLLRDHQYQGLHRRRGDEEVPPIPSVSNRAPARHDLVASSFRSDTQAPPCDLATETYAAIIKTPGFDTYLDYPARIYHLKYPTSGEAAAPEADWEDLHLHQRVSQPRIHARWTRPITTADRTRMRAYFFRFTSPVPSSSTRDILGFRPYRDILLLDAAYLTAHVAHRAALRRLYRRPLDPSASLVPFIAEPDRHTKVTMLAVSASAFSSYLSNTTTTTHPDTRLCELLAKTFPSLRRLLLFAPGVVDRPASAAWDLEVEFARWMPLADALQLEAEQHNYNKSVAAFACAAGLLSQSSARGPGPLVRAVEAAWTKSRDETLPPRRVRLAAIKRATSASLIEKPVGSLPTLAPPPIHVARTSVGVKTGSQITMTGAVVAGGEEKTSFRTEAFVLMYYRDAYERAISKGWKHEALVPLDHLDLGLGQEYTRLSVDVVPR